MADDLSNCKQFNSGWGFREGQDYPEGENDPDGSDQMLSILNGDPTAYQEFAESYYERKIPLSTIKHIYEHNSLTGEIVRLLNQDISIGELQTDIEEIGYPRSAT